jgi:hypothetical protein
MQVLLPRKAGNSNSHLSLAERAASRNSVNQGSHQPAAKTTGKGEIPTPRTLFIVGKLSMVSFGNCSHISQHS